MNYEVPLAKNHEQKIMKTILIPIDFSDHSVSTYKYAIKIAGIDSSIKLILHHSYNDQLTIPDPGLNTGFDNESFLNMQLIEEFRKQSIVKMQDLENEIKSYLHNNNLSNITIETSISGGDADWEIINLCNNIKPDLIVMGTQGNGKKEIFEGSTAKKIMNKANVPVIAVPINDPDFKELRIMYACNNHKKDFAKIQLLAKLFDNIPLKIYVVHFHLKGTKDTNLSLINNLEEAFRNINMDKQINFLLVDSFNKDDALESTISEYSINTIAFISHSKNIFKYLFGDGITKNDFFNLGLPMIALHE